MKLVPIIAVLLIAGLTTAASPAAPAAPCASAGHRQFDFWIGDWRVAKADGTFAGTNHVTLEYGGCVIHEHYVTGNGYAGESLNIYDATRKVWHQTWVDDGGLLLTLEGHRGGNAMVLEGGGQRITWTANADGSVRQLWESRDAKGGWTVAFDGRYTKK